MRKSHSTRRPPFIYIPNPAHSAAGRDDVLVGWAPVAPEEGVRVRVDSVHRSLVAKDHEASSFGMIEAGDNVRQANSIFCRTAVEIEHADTTATKHERGGYATDSTIAWKLCERIFRQG